MINLSWTAPSSNGLPFTLYSIEYTPNGGSPTVVTTSNTSYQLTGLVNGTDYSVRVGAVVGDRVNYSTAVTGTPTSVIFLKLAGNYTGVGTAVSPYSGNTQGSSLFRAEVSGTVYFSFYSAGNTSGDYDASFQILRNGVNVLNQSSGNGFNPAYSSSVSVSAGQTIGMYHSNNESPVIFTAYLVPQ